MHTHSCFIHCGQKQFSLKGGWSVINAYTNSHSREDTDRSFDYILGLTFKWQHTQWKEDNIPRGSNSDHGDQIHFTVGADELDQPSPGRVIWAPNSLCCLMEPDTDRQMWDSELRHVKTE